MKCHVNFISCKLHVILMQTTYEGKSYEGIIPSYLRTFEGTKVVLSYLLRATVPGHHQLLI